MGGCRHVFGPGGFNVNAFVSVLVQPVVAFWNVTVGVIEPSCVPGVELAVVHAIVGNVNPVVGMTTVNVCTPVPTVMNCGVGVTS